MSENMKRMNYCMPVKLAKELEAQAKKSGVSSGHYVRQAVQELLARLTAKSPKRCPNCGWVGTK